MKYFLHTEFHEYKKKPLFGKPIDTIELISIGIVSEDTKKDAFSKRIGKSDRTYSLPGREYYAICKDFDLKAAWNNEWLRENVLKSIHEELKVKEYGGSITRHFTFRNFKWLINEYGKTKKQIAEEIKEFVGFPNYYPFSTSNIGVCNKPEFYAYYADYDWVVFCWLFGRMIDLPKGFPMYCIDLKQTLDEKAKTIPYSYDKELGLKSIKMLKDYPKQTNEHNALANAKWNKELYKFLQNL
jgi:hypothetical protein